MIRIAYESFNAREIDTVLDLMHPDVDWPNGMEGGRVLGRDNVRAYWNRQWQILNPRVEPIHFEDDALGRTTVLVHQVVRDLAGDILVDQVVHHVYSIQDGLIDRMDILKAGEDAASGIPK